MPEETLFFFDFDVFAIALKPLMKFPGVSCRQPLGQASRLTPFLENAAVTADP
jgi:hypothetical protein